MSTTAEQLLAILSPAFPAGHREAMQRAFAAFLAKVPEAELASFLAVFPKHGEDWGFHPRHPLATKLVQFLAELLFGRRANLAGLEHCRRARELAASRPVVMVSNHLSYGDVNYLMAVLAMQGEAEYPLLVLAGPKVYQDPFRKLSSLAFDTLKVAQPPSRASEGAEVSARELAEITRRVLGEAAQWMGRGRILYFFPEGSRSRSGGLNRFLAASARYLELPGAVVLPVGYEGTERLLGVAGGEIAADRIGIRVGAPLVVEKLSAAEGLNAGDRRRLLMDRLGFAVAELLPPALRGEYDPTRPDSPDDPGLAEAKRRHLTGPRASLD